MDAVMRYYVQLSAAGLVVGLTSTAGEIVHDDVVEVPAYEESLIGKLYDRASGGFISPPVGGASALQGTSVSRLAFLSRFSDAEAIDIDLASIGATREAATVRRYLSKVNAAQHIDLRDSDTRAGVQALEAAGLIAAGRAAVILDTPIEARELP
ncbi:hypothetical protein M4R23_09165 [Acidovorax sp. GBBC 3332]|nr:MULTISPECIES: hypothetical protein [unclassified Acidovorax]MDA8449853.1 hypothetical protein [Acidovorax sp. GBBC 3297]MDA8459298.1 hypothetical protein [Acidovorax sp. GBBC 3333]MDA8464335.1 hypothetical protein [Acidovorax sp. GBBC 3332]MDA8469454.1 hypothetical protein [Acidovorax sp. GBBC 3299]